MASNIGYICQYPNRYRMNPDEYRSWLKPLLIEGQIIEPGMVQLTLEMMQQNSRTLIQLIEKHAKLKKYRHLACLAEFLRGEGFFYFDYIDEFATLLEMLLQQSIAVFETGDVFNDEFILWLPLSVYDLIFHQIRFDEYPQICSKLYFDLSKTALNDRFKPLYKSSCYNQCLYFIDMASHRFLERPDEFLELWRMIERQIDEGKGYAWSEENWPAAYGEFVNDQK